MHSQFSSLGNTSNVNTHKSLSHIYLQIDQNLISIHFLWISVLVTWVCCIWFLWISFHYGLCQINWGKPSPAFAFSFCTKSQIDLTQWWRFVLATKRCFGDKKRPPHPIHGQKRFSQSVQERNISIHQTFATCQKKLTSNPQPGLIRTEFCSFIFLSVCSLYTYLKRVDWQRLIADVPAIRMKRNVTI